MTRHINAPGIEANEIDRSNVDYTEDYSLVGTSTFICGFANKGEDYTTKVINSERMLVDEYGYPTNEPEKYFFNAAAEILTKGGRLLMSKLPYYNSAKDKYTYMTYNVRSISLSPTIISAMTTVLQNIISNIGALVTKYSLNINLEPLEDVTVYDIIHALTELSYLNLTESETTTVSTSLTSLQNMLTTAYNDNAMNILALLDSNIQKYLEITNDNDSGKISISKFDSFKTASSTVGLNKIKIVDISRSMYNSVETNCVKTKYGSDSIYTNDCLGILPIIVTPGNALFFQHVLKDNTFDATIIPNISNINNIAGMNTVSNTDFTSDRLDINLTKLENHYIYDFKSESDEDETLSKMTIDTFPTIQTDSQLHFDKTYLKQIGIVVVKAYKDPSYPTMVNFKILESFVGSLDKSEKDEYTKKSIFIDNVVNSQSKYINVFSNVRPQLIQSVDTMFMSNQIVTGLGFYNIDTTKKIHYRDSIQDPLTLILERNKDPNTSTIDLVVDAGLSNIAQLIKNCGLSDVIDFTFKPNISDHNSENYIWSLQSIDDTKYWLNIVKKFDYFCKYTRKDCMFIADCLRTFCLYGEQKLVRPTDPVATVSNIIIPKLKYISQLNSSYTAGYCNWFKVKDIITSEDIWLPPSIKAVGAYLYTDTYFHKWDAPAGMTRGILNTALDCAFNPSNDEAGYIYNQSWNYAVNYPIDGIIIEGQKTMQLKKTAFDRVNVRRLFLYLEKQVVRFAKYFLYEGNTPYLRQRFVDTIDPIFQAAVIGNGIQEYAIKCDDDNNTIQTIENNELHCRIAVKPIKTIEYIVLDFICTNQSAQISETVMY